MKVVVTAEGSDLDSRVDPRFGRCAFFVFVETDNLSCTGFENPSIALGHGAGIQSAQFVAENGAGVVITGNVGPNAYRTLEAAGLQVVTGASGTVRQAVETFKSGDLAAAQGATVEGHFGTGGGMGGGMGGGGGGGRGMGGGGGGRGMGGGGGGRGMGGGGGGRGMGGGMGMGAAAGPGMGPDAFGAGAPPQYQTGSAPPASPEQEVGMLRAQADAMAAQLQAINARIAEVERGTGAALIALVDVNLCDACGQCVDVCPTGAIAMGEAAQIDRAKCNGCARCVAACPQGALSLHKA